MSDTKKPTVSEIRAFQEKCPSVEGEYILDLVERMAEELENQQCPACEKYFGNLGEPCAWCREARELLKEIRL